MTILRISGEQYREVIRLNQQCGVRFDVAICSVMKWAYPDTEFVFQSGGTSSAPKDELVITLTGPIVPLPEEETNIPVAEAAALLGIEPKALRSQFRKGKWSTAFQVGSNWWVKLGEVRNGPK